VLPEAVAGGFIALGLVLVLAAVGILIEFSGAGVAGVQGRRDRVIAGGVGVGLLGWGIWSVVPKSYEITELTIIPRETSYSKPCPKTIDALVAVNARAAPGEVHYLVHFEGQGNVPLERDKIGKNGTSAYRVRTRVPPGAQGKITLWARTVHPNRRWASIPVEFSC
jgi:hypothetical protein